jgi:hypothetical protein
VSAIVRLFIEGRGGNFPWRVKLKRLFRGLQILKLKEVTYSVGLFAEVD